LHMTLLLEDHADIISLTIAKRVKNAGGDPKKFCLKSHETAESDGTILLIEGLVVESDGKEIPIGNCSVRI